MKQFCIVLLCAIICIGHAAQPWIPCPELHSTLKIPCRCQILYPENSLTKINCDSIVFNDDTLQIPADLPIVYFSQRNTGQHHLPIQAFVNSVVPYKSLDFSNNQIQRLPNKVFAGVENTLVELRLANNLLGDNLNPIFSTAEFQVLKVLRILDLSGNRIKALEQGIFKGCRNLEELYIDNNGLSAIPSDSLNGPDGMKVISIADNNIIQLYADGFASQPNLESIRLSNNQINFIAGNSFRGLNKITEIYLNRNKLSKMNSDVFMGIGTLEKLDLSYNYLTEYPTIVLKEIRNMKILNLSFNMINKLETNDFSSTPDLEVLDLSGNTIANLAPGTLRNLKSLKFLDLSLNSLRAIEDDALEGLDSLQTLIIRDNNILLIPGGALGRLSALTNVYLDFNRIAALSSEILGSIQHKDIKYLSLARNVIREIPAGSFKNFHHLRFLDLSGNNLITITSEIFEGLNGSLRDLRLSQNKLASLGDTPLQLHELKKLDLSENDIADINPIVFNQLYNLMHLNLSGNPHLASLPAELLYATKKLRVADFSRTGLKTLPGELFASMTNLQVINLSHNDLQEIGEGSFTNLPNITSIDLSSNHILAIKASAFINTMNLKKLNLRDNKLSFFKGEMFNTGTGLEELDISNNQIGYLFPSSFRIHPRLSILKASNNKFNFFPAELILTLQYLNHIDLSHNQLKSIDDLDFARLPRLRELILRHNELELLGELAFHNSTQLQIIDLGYNKIERLGERTFEGLIRLENLNLEHNNFTDLPDNIFDRTKVQKLESINLSGNRFDIMPLRCLESQHHLKSLDMSRNRIKAIPSNDNVLVNIKKLDLSGNPLSSESIAKLLDEPKIIRELNLAETGLQILSKFETPFLQSLNISNNNLKEIDQDAFSKVTLLESLDISNNQLNDLQKLSIVWNTLGYLKTLNISKNPFESISEGDFEQLGSLRSLSMSDLDQVVRIEKRAFKPLKNLMVLDANNLPRLGYLDLQGVIEYLPGLESLNIDVKDTVVGSDQINLSKHPRLKNLGLHGERLKTISSSILAGFKSQDLRVRFMNTSLSSLPQALLFPVPRSANLQLDITGSKIASLSPQLLAAFDDRRNNLHLKGLDTNPIHCDCNSRALRRWLPNSHMVNLKCTTPNFLNGRRLIEVGDDELTCDAHKHSLAEAHAAAVAANERTSKAPEITSTTTTTPEPEIIWSIPSTQPPPIKLRTKLPLLKAAPLNNDDTLIIGIVGGVVMFIALLIIIICIVRLKMSSSSYRGGPMPIGMPPVPMNANTMPIYTIPPYSQTYATLSNKSMSQLKKQSASSVGSYPYYPNQPLAASQQLMYYPDEKSYR